MAMDDTKTIFEKLVKSRSVADFVEQGDVEFAFETVCDTASLGYCCCSCAIEHEYLNYLNEDGINEEVLQRIKSNIAYGFCPHVKDAPDEFVNTTTICGWHIAAATIQERWPNLAVGNHTGIFQLYPYAIAVLKKNYNMVQQFNNDNHYQMNGFKSFPIPYPKWSLTNPQLVHIKLMTIPEICVSMKDLPLLQCIGIELYDDDALGLYEAFKAALMDNIPEMLDHLAMKMGQATRNINRCIERCITLIIMLNEPGILSNCLRHLNTQNVSTISMQNITEICSFCNRVECSEVLKHFRLYSTSVEQAQLDDRICDSLQSLEREFQLQAYPDQMSKVVRSFLASNSKCLDFLKMNFATHFREGGTFLSEILENGVDVNSIGPGLTECTANGANVISLDGMNCTALERILSDGPNNLHLFHERRATLEMLIFENCDVDLNKQAVKLAICADKNTFEIDKMFSDLYEYCDTNGQLVTILMNGKEQPLYGHKEENFALNFVAPLLLECGYPVARDVLESALDENLHPGEIKYFQNYLNNPRSLQQSCCIALRRELKGRELHNVLKRQNVPKGFTDMILFKNILNCI